MNIVVIIINRYYIRMDKFESLIRMIKSENFTVEMSLQYYIKNLNNLEVLQELANKLYQNPDHSY